MVVSMAEFRDAQAAKDPNARLTCQCGSVWFELSRRPTDPEGTPLAVTMTREGVIDGYTGAPKCLDCGAVQEV
jgi:hypothetical protein